MDTPHLKNVFARWLAPVISQQKGPGFESWSDWGPFWLTLSCPEVWKCVYGFDWCLVDWWPVHGVGKFEPPNDLNDFSGTVFGRKHKYLKNPSCDWALHVIESWLIYYIVCNLLPTRSLVSWPPCAASWPLVMPFGSLGRAQSSMPSSPLRKGSASAFHLSSPSGPMSSSSTRWSPFLSTSGEFQHWKTQKPEKDKKQSK